MRFIFSAPFRTNINLNSPMAMLNHDVVCGIINTKIKEFNDILPKGIEIKNQWKNNNNGKLHYSTLEDDLIPLSAKPFFTFYLNPEIALIDVLKSLPLIGYTTKIHHCNIDYYNNTVAILKVDVEIINPENNSKLISSIDNWSTNLCSKIIFLIKDTEYSFHSFLTKTTSGIIAKGLFKNVDTFNVFIDRNNIDPEKAKNQEELLWVTRVLFCEPDNESSYLEE